MLLRAKRSSPPAVRAPLLLLVHFDSRGWATTRLLRGEAATLVEHYAPQAGNVEQTPRPTRPCFRASIVPACAPAEVIVSLGRPP